MASGRTRQIADRLRTNSTRLRTLAHVALTAVLMNAFVTVYSVALNFATESPDRAQSTLIDAGTGIVGVLAGLSASLAALSGRMKPWGWVSLTLAVFYIPLVLRDISPRVIWIGTLAVVFLASWAAFRFVTKRSRLN